MQNQLIDLFIRLGPIAAKTACQALGISQPKFSRLIHALGERIISVGKARSTTYALIRTGKDLPHRINGYSVSPQGKTRLALQLTLIEPNGYCVELKNGNDRQAYFTEQFPFYLHDLFPRGYLGRMVPRKYSNLSVPKDILRWSEHDCLKYLLTYGWNNPGNLIIGEDTMQLYLEKLNQPFMPVQKSERKKKYSDFAESVLESIAPGSSAAGEQPKFLATIVPDNIPVIVKFSPKNDNKVAQRVADLLVCEFIALQHLKQAGYSVSESELIHTKTHTFLQVSRFDREGINGRKGIVSLEALANYFSDPEHSWAQVLADLKQEGLYKKSNINTLKEIEAFGHLIANTDMHLGNFSLFNELDELQDLAPVYDMLPMLYMPKDNNLIDRNFSPPIPDAMDSKIWRKSYALAMQYWQKVAQTKKISAEFQKIALSNIEKLKAQADIYAALPES